MRRIAVVVFCFTTALLHFAAVDSGSRATNAQVDAAAQVAKKSLATPTPQTFISDQILNLFRLKAPEKRMARATASVKTAQSPLSKATVQKPRSTMKPGYVPPPPPTTMPAQTRQIRQEIQTILELNKKIKNMQGARVQQLQQIQEQARIHQKILDQVDDSKSLPGTRKAPDRDALMEQATVQVVREKTKQSQILIEEVVAEDPAEEVVVVEEAVAVEEPQTQAEGDELNFAPVDQDGLPSWS